VTVTVQDTVFSHTGNGVSTVFGFGCLLLAQDDMVVLVDGEEQLGGYTVSGLGSPAGGNVTFSSPPANGAAIILQRKLSLKRETDYQQFGDWKAGVVNPDFDRLWMANQQQQEELERAARFPVGTKNKSAELPLPAAGRGLKWDSNEGVLVNTSYDLDALGASAASSASAAAASASSAVSSASSASSSASAASGSAASAASSASAAAGSASTASSAASTASAISAGLADPTGSSLVGFKQAGTGAVNRTVQDRLREMSSVKDFGAVGNGTTDDATAVGNAMTSSPRFIRLPYASGGYRISSLTVGGYDGLGGDKMLESYVSTDGITVNGAFTEIKNVRLDTGASANYAVTYVTDTNIYANFANHINNVRLFGLNGITNGGAETKIQNVYGKGTGNTNGGTFLNITNWDTSAHTIECEDYQTGVRTNGRGYQGVDTHVVRADTAIAVSSQGHPTQLVNNYLDTPRSFGAQFSDMSDASFVNTYVLNVGDAATSTSASGILLDTTSTDNNFINTYFKQADDTKWAGGFGFQSGSINNLIVGAGGSYKLTTNSKDRIRNQTVLGCHGGWARHNNVPRMNRAYAPAVAVGAQTTLAFQLDWTYPTLTFNTVLFVGNYVSRTTSSKAAVGRFIIPISYSDIGCSPVVEKLTGSPNNNWAIISASLSGSVLSVVVQNNSEATAGISVELQRSLDAISATY
jgi:hypothetical protein